MMSPGWTCRRFGSRRVSSRGAAPTFAAAAVAVAIVLQSILPFAHTHVSHASSPSGVRAPNALSLPVCARSSAGERDADLAMDSVPASTVAVDCSVCEAIASRGAATTAPLVAELLCQLDDLASAKALADSIDLPSRRPDRGSSPPRAPPHA